MATIRTSLDTAASADDAWAGIRDIGAVHTRLGAGLCHRHKARARRSRRDLRQRHGHPRADRHDRRRGRRLVWTAEGGYATHYNASLQVGRGHGGANIVWGADFLPDEIRRYLSQAIEAGIAIGGGARADQTPRNGFIDRRAVDDGEVLADNAVS